MAANRPGTSFKVIKMFMEAGEDVTSSNQLYRRPWFEFFPVRLQEGISWEPMTTMPDFICVVNIDVLTFPGNLHTSNAISKVGKSIELGESEVADLRSLIPKPNSSLILHCDHPVPLRAGGSLSMYTETMALALYSGPFNQWIGKIWIDEGYGFEIGAEGHQEVVRVVIDNSEDVLDALDEIWSRPLKQALGF